MKVLIVEDDVNLIESINSSLELRGIEGVVFALTVREGLAAIRASHWDKVITDWELPDGTGRDLLEQAQLANTEVVLWSGLDRTKECEGMKFPPDRIILKGMAGIEEVLSLAGDS